jgi:hypothetical protein
MLNALLKLKEKFAAEFVILVVKATPPAMRSRRCFRTPWTVD